MTKKEILKALEEEIIASNKKIEKAIEEGYKNLKKQEKN